MAFLSYLIARAREPSSWAAVTALLVGFGVHLDPAVGAAVVAAGTALAGLVAVFLPDKPKTPTP